MINTAQEVLWHTKQWEQVSQMLSQDRFAHALLLEGMSGVGKGIFAFQLAQMLLCTGESSSGICQHCSSCEWFLAETHPDFVHLKPEDGKKLISVDAIRQATQKVFNTSHQNGYRILIIEPADAMTIEAANSLLKTLEEPPAQTLLMLLTDKPARLLPTIRSRARRLKFTLPDAEYAATWLQGQGLTVSQSQQLLALSLGAPMRLSLEPELLESVIEESRLWWQEWQSLFTKDSDPVRTAKAWSRSDPNLFLPWMDTLLRNLIKLSIVSKSNQNDQNIDLQKVLFPGLDRFIGIFNYSSLFSLRDNVVELSQRQNGSLNWSLQLESLACDCYALGAKK